MSAERIARLQSTMRDAGCDLLVLSAGAHLGWLLRMRPHADERPFLLMITQTKAGFLMPALEASSCRPYTDLPFFEWDDADGPEGAVQELLENMGVTDPASVAVDESMRADHALFVLNRFPAARQGFAEETIGALRLQKQADEYEALKANFKIADAAMVEAAKSVRPGMTERDVADVIKGVFLDQNAKAVFTIVGSGGNGALPHHSASDRVIEDGEAIVIDLGGTNGAYFSDITRSVVVGTPPDGYEAVVSTVERAVQAALATAKPGVQAKEVDLAARSVIEAAGYGEYFTHRLGHGLGFDVHEPPYVTAMAETVLQEGMVFSIEPGIYTNGAYD